MCLRLLTRPFTRSRSAAADGYVSLEVSPHLAQDMAGTLEEARRLWGLVKRPNLMIKVPGTDPGIAAFVVSYDELIAGVEQKRAGLSA